MKISEIKDVPLRHLAQTRVTKLEDKDNLDLAFYWCETPEGWDFWNGVFNEEITKLDKHKEYNASLPNVQNMRGTRTHYENPSAKYDVIDIIKDYDLNFNRGNIVKYVLRCGKKDNEVQELEKAKDYIERELVWLREQQEIWIENNK
jgi:hypothetical protein